MSDTEFLARTLTRTFNNLAGLSESDVKLIAKALLKSKTLKDVMPVFKKLSNNIKIDSGKAFLSNEVYKDLAGYDISKHTAVINECLDCID